MDNLDGKVAVVTGAARGIGRAISLRLASDGADVAVADTNLPGAESVATEIRSTGRSAIALEIDVTRESQVERMVAETTRQLGRVDIAVANAGIVISEPYSASPTTNTVWGRSPDLATTGHMNRTVKSRAINFTDLLSILFCIVHLE